MRHENHEPGSSECSDVVVHKIASPSSKVNNNLPSIVYRSRKVNDQRNKFQIKLREYLE